jgi:hypothetical protein
MECHHDEDGNRTQAIDVGAIEVLSRHCTEAAGLWARVTSRHWFGAMLPGLL